MNMKRPASGPVSPDPAAHNDSMRRLQIGIAGVMAVLLLVGLAGLIGDRAREQVNNEAVAANPVQTGTVEKGSGARAAGAASRDRRARRPAPNRQAPPDASCWDRRSAFAPLRRRPPLTGKPA